MLKLLNILNNHDEVSNQTAIYRAMLRREAEAGGRLFGEIPKDTHREFFCLDVNTWVWHEEWKDKDGNYRHRTTRYDVRPSGILKDQNGQGYQRLSTDETEHLLAAVRLYKTEVIDRFYGSYKTAAA